MSAFSTVSDVFSYPEFSAPGQSFLCGLGALEEQNRERTGFLIMPKAPIRVGVWIHMAATSLTTQRWASDLVINLLTSLCSYLSAPPICLAPPASRAASMHNLEEWNAGITNMTVREGDVHDRDPVRQGHVSAYLFTPSAAACESLASPLCSPTALTLGHFASSLCLCLCLHGLAGTGQSPRRDSQALCLTSSGQVLVFLCVSLVSQQHIPHLFA